MECNSNSIRLSIYSKSSNKLKRTIKVDFCLLVIAPLPYFSDESLTNFTVFPTTLGEISPTDGAKNLDISVIPLSFTLSVSDLKFSLLNLFIVLYFNSEAYV